MCEVKWIKINTSMFENEKIKLIDAMSEKDTIQYIWIRLLVQAGKTNDKGYIYLNKKTPFTQEMLSTIFGRPINSVRLALDILVKFGMIKIDKNNFIKITNWEKHQNVEGMEKVREQSRKRMQKMRAKRKKEQQQSNVTVTQQDINVTDKKERIENENEKENREEENNIVEIQEIREEKKKAENISNIALCILSYYEKITGKVGLLNHSALVIAIQDHGEENVRLAIDKSLELNKFNMTYINGILRNWAKEGYPKKKGEYKNNGIGANHNEFTGFEPKAAKELSKEERSIAESKLV